MKRITLIIGALSMLMCTTTSSYPQATLKLSNNSGKGRLLTANFTRSDVVSVAWKANGKVIFTSGSSAIGVTVAGGRCQGSAPDQLNNPNGVFVDKDNNIWVADASNGRVQKFANGSRDASTFGAEFPNAPSFPVNVFVNKNGDVYVADYFEGKVKLLRNGGSEWINVAGQNNELDLVRGVWVDKDGNVYCTQYGFFFNGTFELDGMVLKYPPNSSEFQVVAGHNGIGAALNQFSQPTSVMVDKDGNIYVADGTNDHGQQNARVMKWAPGATEGEIVAGGNGEGEAPDQCPTPLHAFVDEKGNVYVSNFVSAKVTKWKKNGKTGEVVAGGNGPGDASDQLNFPLGIYLKENFLYVVDVANHRVQRFDVVKGHQQNEFKPRHPGSYTVVATLENGSTIETNSVVVPPSTDNTLNTVRGVNRLVAYPNPANNSVTISFDATSAGRYFYELSDLSGKLLLKKQVNVSQGIRNETFDLQPYAKGTYLISVVKPNNIKESIKVIRQ
jgi:sugar lactone lactonase YvrE